MLTSGTTAVATNDDNPVELVAVDAVTPYYRGFTIINEGAVAGFYSIDGGTTWARLPASGTVTVQHMERTFRGGIKVKRVAGGTNLATVWGFSW